MIKIINQIAIALFIILLLSSILYAQEEDKKDVWESFKFFLGAWEGKTTGKSGEGMIEREYQFVLGGEFIQVKNKAVFEPQEKNPKGEVHEDWGIFSYDQNRKKIVFRQFNIEGYVNRYVLDSLSEDGNRFVFVTEEIENIPSGWRAKIVCEILNQNVFKEVFELAPPGKNFAACVENYLKRKK